MIVKITNHAEDCQLDLLAQHRGRPVIAAMVESYVERLQLIEDAFFQMLASFAIDSATGAALDAHGLWVLESRQGRLDDPYRAAIKARGSLYRSRGTVDDIIAAVRIFASSSALAVGYRQAGIAEYELTFQTLAGGTLAAADAVATSVLPLSPAGVKAYVIYTATEAAPPFRFDTVGAGLNQGRLWSQVVGV